MTGWDKEALKLEVERYPEGEIINWSDLARRYNVKNKKGEIAKNGGQIVQDWLISQGVNIHQYRRLAGYPNGERRTRRKKIRGAGGTVNHNKSSFFLSLPFTFLCIRKHVHDLDMHDDISDRGFINMNMQNLTLCLSPPPPPPTHTYVM